MSAVTNTSTTAEQAKLIAIMGATGSQGGAAVKAFHALKKSGNESYRIRAITRNPESEKAKAIAPLVDEIVKADANDKESMIAAFEGSYGVYVVSDFWEDMDVEHEMQLLRTVKDALKKTDSVKHIVVSTFQDSRTFVTDAANKDSWKVLHKDFGMYVPPFDGKAQVTEEFSSEGLPITRFHTSFYYENFIYFGMGPSRQHDTDPYAITLPFGDAKIPAVAVADIGKALCAIFQDKTLIGKTVGVASELVSGQDIAETFAKVCGVEVIYNAVPWDVYASFDFPGADVLANMFRFKVEYNEAYNKIRIVSEQMKKQMGGLIALEDWVREHKSSFPKP